MAKIITISDIRTETAVLQFDAQTGELLFKMNYYLLDENGENIPEFAAARAHAETRPWADLPQGLKDELGVLSQWMHGKIREHEGID
ncbi:MAG: hypothetical protein KDE51_13530 [Anaerolineales bacterium]|nr:hypothetical protein [Anaerolineales bacterium]